MLIISIFIFGLILISGAVSAADTNTSSTLSKSSNNPDLTVVQVRSSVNALRGQKIVIKNSIKNQGTRASGGFLSSFYLKSPSGIRKIGSRYIAYLGPGSINTKYSSFLLPTTLPEGYYQTRIITDSTKRITEIRETNNQVTTTTKTRIIDPTRKPSTRVKLIFIHHSCGSNWLQNGNGNLGYYLNRNNYYVNESDYGWSAEDGDYIGDRTDTIHWPEWFTNRKMYYVNRSNYNSAYQNIIPNPGGQNQIIMIKSCFPNSEVGDSIGDEKAIYNRIKTYFAAHPEKLFVLITPPGETQVDSYRLTKLLCNWLVDKKNGWLKGYKGKNVMVFDFYGVLSETNSHHRWVNNNVQYVYASNYDGVSPYHDGDDHPNISGNRKATSEFIKLLNYAYNVWKT
jgi:hypothetical protein